MPNEVFVNIASEVNDINGVYEEEVGKERPMRCSEKG